MGWSVGEDSERQRFIGYGVPAYCDHPGCGAEINRGLSYVCGDEPYGGEFGCGMFFCPKHRRMAGARRGFVMLCARCWGNTEAGSYPCSPEHPTWMRHLLTDESWDEWRAEHPDTVAAFRAALALLPPPPEESPDA